MRKLNEDNYTDTNMVELLTLDLHAIEKQIKPQNVAADIEKSLIALKLINDLSMPNIQDESQLKYLLSNITLFKFVEKKPNEESKEPIPVIENSTANPKDKSANDLAKSDSRLKENEDKPLSNWNLFANCDKSKIVLFKSLVDKSIKHPQTSKLQKDHPSNEFDVDYEKENDEAKGLIRVKKLKDPVIKDVDITKVKGSLKINDAPSKKLSFKNEVKENQKGGLQISDMSNGMNNIEKVSSNMNNTTRKDTVAVPQMQQSTFTQKTQLQPKVVSQPNQIQENKNTQMIPIFKEPQPQTNSSSTQPSKINEPTVTSSTMPTPIKNKLLKGAENYLNLKPILKQIADSPQYKRQTDTILMTLNTIINQACEASNIPAATGKLKGLLSEIYSSRNEELYLSAIDQMIKIIMRKSENYVTERNKRKFLDMANLIYMVRCKAVNNLFFELLALKCPYIIPTVFTKKDFSDTNTLKKRLGFNDPDESISEWNNRMEAYSYLYFAFLSLHDKSAPIIKEYLDNLEVIPLHFSLSSSYKVFLNVLGNLKRDSFLPKLQKISDRMIQAMEQEKKKTKQNENKSVINANIYYIKSYLKSITNMKPTDMYE